MTRNPKVWYTSDTHIGHKLVARERGFVHDGGHTEIHRGVEVPLADVEAHDRYLARMWDMTVGKDDTVFILGDISINGSDHALEWHAERPGKKVLIIGNHDPVWGFHRDSYKVYEKWNKVFYAMLPFLRRKLGGHYFLMSHFPYAGTGAEGHGVEDRALQYRLPDMGMPLLHGHTHGKEKYHKSDNGSHELHVGLDAWDLNLVSQDTIQGWLERPTSSFYKAIEQGE